MKHHLMVRSLLLSLALTAGSGAFAQVSFNIVLAPPAPVHEMVPVMPQGYVWAPGYWAWNVDRHIWVRGRSMLQRTGYRWEPDRWEQHSGNYVRQPGRWERDVQARPAPVMDMQQPRHDNGQRRNGKKDKKDKRWKDERDNQRNKGH